MGRQLGISRILSCCIATTVCLSVGSAVEAQTSGPAAVPGGEANNQDIIVTAQKRGERLSRTPLAITALSGAQLQAAGVQGVRDLTSAAPSIQISTVGPANAILVAMRGISNADFNAGGSPEVATYVDGIYIGRTTGLNGSFYDLDRVEIVRGPQGTLYGRNSTGGNINILTADPVHGFHASLDGSYGNYNDAQLRGMVNLPVSDTLAVRGAFAIHRNDGYFDTQGSTDRNYGKAKNYAGRITGLWQPTNAFKWRLSVDHFAERGTPFYSVDTGMNGKPADGLSVFKRPIPNTDGPIDNIDNTMIRSRMDLKLNSALSIDYLAGYQRVKSLDQESLTADTYDGSRPETFKGQSQEADINLDVGRLTNIAGANYYHSSTLTSDKYRLPVYGIFSDTAALGPSHYHDTSWGVFDQAKFRVTDKLNLTGGVRYSHERQDVDPSASSTCPLNLYPDLPFGSGHFFGPGCSLTTQPANSARFSSVTWKANAEYTASRSTFLYAGVTTGFKSGGLNPPITGVANYGPEKVTNYEGGIRWKDLDGRANLSITGYYMKYTDIQVNQFIRTNGITTNAGGADIYGTEIEGRIALTKSDTLNGFLTYTHATYFKFLNAVDQQTGAIYPDISGNSLPHAPRFTARIEYSHVFQLANGATVTPKASVYWQSKNYLRELNLPIDTVGSYSQTSLELAYLSLKQNWRLSAFVHNLENRYVRTFALTALGRYFSDYLPPRTFGVSASYHY